MSGLVLEESSLADRSRSLRRGGVAVSVALLAGLAVMSVIELSRAPPVPIHQHVRIRVLSDARQTPPAPAPAKPREIELRSSAPERTVQARPPVAGASLPVKMEGETGTGPSPFAAGQVANDYIGGPTDADGRFASYSRRVERLLEAELAHRRLRALDARIFLWLKSDGALERVVIDRVSGNDRAALQAAIGDLGRIADPPPADLPMPLGLDISVH